MPTFPVGVTVVTKASVSLSFVDVQGERAPVALEIPATSASNTAGVASWRDDVAQASNAALVKTSLNSKAEVNTALASAYDEAQSSVYAKATLVFQNEDLDSVSFAIPAPDQSIFSADRKTVDPDNALIAAIITTTLVLLNGIGGADDTYAYARGYSSYYANRGSGVKTYPIIVEPDTGDLPPEAPGDNPV